jgi:hypothetical protein
MPTRYRYKSLRYTRLEMHVQSMTRTLLSSSRRHAFGKTSIASTGDIDFFLPDTGPLSTESYRKRLTTSMGTKQVKLPKSGVQVRQP